MELDIIKNKIYEIRGQRVMLDRDLAQLYGVETKVLNQAVRRNIERFPEDFMFTLSKEECLRSQIVTLNEARGHHLKYMPLAFTEQGVAMLSSVLRSRTAIEINISIMRAFVVMRNYASIPSNASGEFAEFKNRLLQIEQFCKDNAKAISDLSEDVQKEMDDIYVALSELAAMKKSIGTQDERPRIGFKK